MLNKQNNFVVCLHFVKTLQEFEFCLINFFLRELIDSESSYCFFIWVSISVMRTVTVLLYSEEVTVVMGNHSHPNLILEPRLLCVGKSYRSISNKVN